MSHWSCDAIFYHIYPLGLTGAPERNDFSQPPVARLEQLYDWMPHLKAMGVNALYLGPLFESTAHGYDTADYYHVDRRLGSDETLAKLSRRRCIPAAYAWCWMRCSTTWGGISGLSVTCNHVARIRPTGTGSTSCASTGAARTAIRSPMRAGRGIMTWSSSTWTIRRCASICCNAVASWMDVFAIDGLRLDAADVIDLEFLQSPGGFLQGPAA